MTKDYDTGKILKLTPHFVILSLLFIFTYSVDISGHMYKFYIGDLSGDKIFIVINLLISVYCTIMLGMGILLKNFFSHIFLGVLIFLIIFDLYIIINYLVVGFYLSNFVILCLLVFLAHSYLVFSIIKMEYLSNS